MSGPVTIQEKIQGWQDLLAFRDKVFCLCRLGAEVGLFLNGKIAAGGDRYINGLKRANLVDGDHDRGGFDHGVGGLAFF